MPNVLITGANRGLGLEFARQYAAQGWTVFATCRHPEQATALHALGGTVFPVDVTDPAAITALVAGLDGQPLDLLINNAGIYGPQGSDPAAWAEVFAVNVIAPVRLAEALLSNLLAGTQRKVAFLSSQMGSIADNSSGGSMIYRSSKAALNAAVHGLAIDWRKQGIIVLALHPGWVRTDMGGPQAPLTPDQSITGLRCVIASATLSESGGFRNYLGQTVPW